MMRRRQFLLLGRLGSASRELSCEALYMRLVDARSSGTTRELLQGLERELRGVRHLRLRESPWLAAPELNAGLEPLLATFRARNGRVELD